MSILWYDILKSYRSGYVRQNILISSFPSPEMNALAGNHCRNYEGRVKIRRKSPGMMNNIVVPTQNVFHRISCPDSTAACEARFCCFINKVIMRISVRFTLCLDSSFSAKINRSVATHMHSYPVLF